MKVKKEMEVLSRAIERAVLTPQEKVAVGRSLQRLAAIMAGYSDAGDKGVIGGYNGTFPLTAATAGNIYLEPKTGKYYRCETNYNGTQITGPNSNFVDLSVVANADRLNNLEKYYSKIIGGTDLNNLKNTGFYACTYHGHNCLNSPTFDNFTLQIYNGYYIHQILESKSKMWIRYYDADNKTWYEWKKII